MSGHTPGPWQVRFCRDQWGGTYYKVVQHTHTAIAVQHDGSYWPLAHEPSADEDGYYQPDDQMDCMGGVVANARLIAAAPALLEAMLALVDSFEKHRPKEVWDNARAAIAAAKEAGS